MIPKNEITTKDGRKYTLYYGEYKDGTITGYDRYHTEVVVDVSDVATNKLTWV